MLELNISYIDFKKKQQHCFKILLDNFYLFNFLVQGSLVLSKPVTAS